MKKQSPVAPQCRYTIQFNVTASVSTGINCYC